MPPLYILHEHVAKDCARSFTKNLAADANTHLVAEIVGTEA